MSCRTHSARHTRTHRCTQAWSNTSHHMPHASLVSVMQQSTMCCGRLAAPAGVQDGCVPHPATRSLHIAALSSRRASLTMFGAEDTHAARHARQSAAVCHTASSGQTTHACIKGNAGLCQHSHRRPSYHGCAMLCHPSAGCCCVQQYLSIDEPLHLIIPLCVQHILKTPLHMPHYRVQYTHR
jgi:hypothetical protein